MKYRGKQASGTSHERDSTQALHLLFVPCGCKTVLKINQLTQEEFLSELSAFPLTLQQEFLETGERSHSVLTVLITQNLVLT